MSITKRIIAFRDWRAIKKPQEEVPLGAEAIVTPEPAPSFVPKKTARKEFPKK